MAEILVEFGEKGAGVVLEQIKKVTRSVDQLRSNMKSPLGLGDSMLNAKNFSTRSIDDLNKKLGDTKRQASGAAGELGFVNRVLASMAIRAVVHDIAAMADQWTNFQNKIRTVLDVQSDLAFVSKDLIAIAKENRTSLEAVGAIYTRTARAVQGLGKSQQDTEKFTKTLSKAVQVGGSTSVEASNAMIQLSQGLSSGTLKGDELRSVLEQLPIVAKLIADKMGVAVGALRKLGSEGKLTTEVVFDAILEASGKMDAQFAKLKPTIEQMSTVLKDQFMVAIGQSGGLIDKMAEGLKFLSDNFDVVFKAVTALTAGLVALTAGKAIGWIGASLLNPWIGIPVAIATALTALYAFSDQINVTIGGTVKLSDLMGVFETNATNAFKNAVDKSEDWFDATVRGFGIMGTAVENFVTKFALIAGGANVFTVMADETGRAAKNLEDSVTWWQKLKDAIGKNPNDKGASSTAKAFGYDRSDVDRAAAIAEGQKKDKFWTEQTEREAKFNALRRQQETPLPITEIPKQPGKKEHGATFEQLIGEAITDDANNKLGDLENKVQTRLHDMLKKLKPSIQAAMKDMDGQIAAVNKQFVFDYSKNYEKWQLDPKAEADARKKLADRIAGIKATSAEYAKQKDQLEELVRQDTAHDYWSKENLRIQKETEEAMKKSVDERMKLLKEEEDTRKRLIEETADKQVARADKLKGIAGTLSPNEGIREKIKDLEIFKQFAERNATAENHLAEWAISAESEIQKLRRAMRWDDTIIVNFAGQFDAIFGQGGTLIKGFSDAIAKSIVFTQSAKDLKRALIDLLNSVQTQALSALIQLPLDLAMGSVKNALSPQPSSAFSAAGTTSVTKFAGSSLSQGSGAETIGGGLFFDDVPEEYSSGGYTGNYGTNDVAGVVHGQEYVLNADATRRMGKSTLDAINSGASPVNKSQTNVTVHNYAGVEVQTNQISPGEIEVMINRAIQTQTPKVVAGHINDSNSIVSRSISKNIDAPRRR